jgi:citronellol/citronellal dehydrogenase
MAVYGSSKAALNRLTNGLAAELAEAGIRVNTIEPRIGVATEGAVHLVGDLFPTETFETMEEMVEATVALCAAPAECTGRVCVSLDLIAECELVVRGLDARPLPPACPSAEEAIA